MIYLDNAATSFPKPPEVIRAMAGVEEKMGAKGFDDAEKLCAWADIVLLAVKPQVLKKAVEPLKKALAGKAVASIAAGWTVAQLTELLPGSRICRIMPNTPAMVGAGMAAIAKESTFTEEEFACIEHVFQSVGRAVVVEEHLMSAVTAVSGSGPAYVFMMIEAMADAAVKLGIPRDKAYVLAAHTVAGSAEMVLETKKHPAELKDMVCSPAGTTIDAVEALEQHGFRAALMDAMTKCAEKSKKLGK